MQQDEIQPVVVQKLSERFPAKKHSLGHEI
jgi:hypothetical protein